MKAKGGRESGDTWRGVIDWVGAWAWPVGRWMVDDDQRLMMRIEVYEKKMHGRYILGKGS